MSTASLLLSQWCFTDSLDWELPYKNGSLFLLPLVYSMAVQILKASYTQQPYLWIYISGGLVLSNWMYQLPGATITKHRKLRLNTAATDLPLIVLEAD